MSCLDRDSYGVEIFTGIFAASASNNKNTDKQRLVRSEF